MTDGSEVIPGTSNSNLAMDIPWIEKYRPRRLEDVASQEEVVNALRNTLLSNNLPHLLFYGPPGTGKTSTILAMARQLWGPDLMRSRVLELNASHERGIDVVRDKIKTFAQIAVSANENVPGYPCPPFKLIILDEADSMTKDAQSALRRTIETYAKVTRFCIICNYVSRIIDPITSRCAKFRYRPLAHEALIARLNHICTSEGFQATDKALELVKQISEGDMRRGVNLLQSSVRVAGLLPNRSVAVDSATLSEDHLMETKDSSATAHILRAQHVEEVAGAIPQQVVNAVWAACKAHSFQHLQNAANAVIAAGYPVDQLFPALLQLVVASEDVTDIGRAQICARMAEAEAKLIEGADEWLQLMDVMSVAATAIRDAV